MSLTISKNELERHITSHHIKIGAAHSAIGVGEAGHTQHFSKCEWGYKNLIGAKGGINDSTKIVGQYMTEVWALMKIWAENDITFEFRRPGGGTEYILKTGGKDVYSNLKGHL